MIAYAAIDLREGRVVQLIGGRPEQERLRLADDPVAVAVRFASLGFRALHVVDLDGALDSGSNHDEARRILAAVDIPVQIGGGIRTDQDIDAWLDAGAARVIVGTRAISDPDWLAAAAARHPGRVVAAADLRGEMVVSHGWQRDSGVPVGDFLPLLASLPLAGLLVTDVGREGSLGGVDAALFRRVAGATPLPLIAAGGIGSIEDLRSLAAAGIPAAVVGTALYTGAVDPGAVAEEFHS
jgi:phosphoribosylformimino-5-aminoimidazole carboxamide ribotide isomerase